MITKVNAYQSSDGTAHSTLEEAQRFEIKQILLSSNVSIADGDDLSWCIIKNAEAIVDILTTTPTSKPKARKVNGGTKKRKKGDQPLPLPLVEAEEMKK